MKGKIMNRADSNSPSRASVRVEANVGEGFWRKGAQDTLPPPDMVGPYMRNRPVPQMPVPGRKAWIIGSGIAGLAAAFYLMRDGGMKGEDITILDALQVTGGSLDGAGNAEQGYIVRGGREMNWNYDNFWDLFQDVPALELPAGYSVLDEYRWVNDNDPNWSKARLMHKQGQLRDFATLGLSKGHQWEIVKLLLKRKEDLDDITIEQYFSKGFLETNFWYLWRSMFAFENWQSLLEMKLYMHRFLDAIDGLTDMSALVFPKYNQYDSFVVPLTRMLREQGVRVQFDTRAHDLELREEGGKRTVTAIRCKVAGREETIAVGADDVVFALTGSMTEGTAYGDMDSVPVLARANCEPGEDSDWTLWRNLAKKSPVFGKPEKFCGDMARSMWESATLTCKPSPLVAKLSQRSVFGQDRHRRRHHLHRFQLGDELHLQPPAALSRPAWRRAGAVGLRAADGQGRQPHQEAHAGLHRSRDPGRAVPSPGHFRSAGRGGRQHQGAPGADALHHRAVHAARRGRPAPCGAARLHQSGLAGPVRGDQQRCHLHHGELGAHRAHRRLHAAGPAQAGGRHQPHAIRHPQYPQGRAR
jgi:hypothetical protein